MTPPERRACLKAIGWSQRGLADRLGYDEGVVRRWMRGNGGPPRDVDAWLESLAAFHREHPAPVRG
jgi:transcriptional regulator with XRE-family HTH domain